MKYSPPFSLSSNCVNLIAKIIELLKQWPLENVINEEKLKLRRINRIQTIKSSLAIEGNKLSEEQVTALLNGKVVIAHPREIQEVKNALAVYDLVQNLNPFALEDLLKAHSIMMQYLTDYPGSFRNTSVGVVSGEKIIHVAPPHKRVPTLMNELFEWLNLADVHLLIKSCVFHYEFEFIHPFTDGNGRIGRLWQSLILTKLHPVFQYLPVENIVFEKQQDYYEAIQQSTDKTNCGIFVEFMLDAIYKSLKTGSINGPINGPIKEVLKYIELNPGSKVSLIAKQANLSTRTIKRMIKQLKELKKIKYVGARKNGGYFIT